jgi:ceramide glucosyltransferase
MPSSVSFSTAIAAVTTLLTLAGFGFYFIAIWSARAFLNRGPRHARSWRDGAGRPRFPAGFAPPVTILKPLRGIDPAMADAFASHCRQQYPGDYEILFGVSSLDDPAAAAVHQLQAEFPDRNIRLMVCPENLGPNGKISVVAQLLPYARYDYFVLNDSDIHVGPHYLAHVLAPFPPSQNQKPVGLVTALYRGRSHGTLGSKLEALGISTDFMPSVLTARFLERGLHFGLGSTLAFSRTALDAAFPEGLVPLATYIADDYQLGAQIDRAGFRVELAAEVVETSVPAYNFRGFVEHQLRWLRTVRDSRPAGYAGLACANLLAWAFLNLIASGISLFSIALFCMALFFRVTLALGVGVGIVNDRQVLRDLWLLLPRDLVSLTLWAWSYASDTVTWRGETFIIKKGRLSPKAPAPAQ